MFSPRHLRLLALCVNGWALLANSAAAPVEVLVDGIKAELRGNTVKVSRSAKKIAHFGNEIITASALQSLQFDPAKISLDFPNKVTTRFFRVVQTTSQGGFWSIHEVGVYGTEVK